MDFTKMTDVDAAYYILQNNGEEPMYYKDLILKTIELKKKPVRNPENPEAEAISEIYTQINMDSRFHYAGDGKWGLTEWNPPETKRSSRGARSAASNKAKTNQQRTEKLFESIQED